MFQRSDVIQGRWIRLHLLILLLQCLHVCTSKMGKMEIDEKVRKNLCDKKAEGRRV